MIGETVGARMKPAEVHTKPEERQRLLQFGKALGRAIEELITIVSPSSFYRWVSEKPEDVVQVDRDQVVIRSYVGGLVKSFEKWPA